VGYKKQRSFNLDVIVLTQTNTHTHTHTHRAGRLHTQTMHNVVGKRWIIFWSCNFSLPCPSSGTVAQLNGANVPLPRFGWCQLVARRRHAVTHVNTSIPRCRNVNSNSTAGAPSTQTSTLSAAKSHQRIHMDCLQRTSQMR